MSGPGRPGRRDLLGLSLRAAVLVVAAFVIVAPLSSIEYTYAVGQRAEVHKRVDYYLMCYEGGSESDSDPREVLQARWWSWEEALAVLSFENERQVAEQARRRAGEEGI